MQIKYLKTFLAIAETGSFHAAAEVMCITQAAVSMQMKTLEEQLKLELFERNVRPPRLSNSAKLILEQIKEIVEKSEKLVNNLSVSGQLSGSIRIGTIPGISFLLPETLLWLRKKYRNLQIRVFSHLTDELVSQVLSGKLDAAVISEPRVLNQQLLSRQIMSEPLVVLAPKNLTGSTDRSLLKDNSLISFNRKAEVSLRIEEVLKSQNIKVDPIMEIDTLETFQVMVQKGLGVGILPISSVRPHLRDSLYLVPFGSPPVQRIISLIQRTDHHKTNTLDAFFEAMKENINKDQIVTRKQV